jgi:hypothetical protein
MILLTGTFFLIAIFSLISQTLFSSSRSSLVLGINLNFFQAIEGFSEYVFGFTSFSWIFFRSIIFFVKSIFKFSLL